MKTTWIPGPRSFRLGKPRRLSLAETGTTHAISYLTKPSDCVQESGPGREWSDKPPVVASAAIIRLCEQVCMQALLAVTPCGHCSLGNGQQFEHSGPVVIGAEIRLTARCVKAQGSYSRWQVTVLDAHGRIGAGWMAFVIVSKAAFESRSVAPKYAALVRPR
jgi:predicted thioesterase